MTCSESSYSHIHGVLEAPRWKFPQGALSFSDVSTNQPGVIAQHSRERGCGASKLKGFHVCAENEFWDL